MENLIVNTSLTESPAVNLSSDLYKYKHLDGKKALVIEDDYVNFLFISELLSCFGMEIYRSLSLEQAVKRVSLFHNLDLVILNNSLTRNRIDIIRYLRKEISAPFLLLVSDNEKYLIKETLPEWTEQIITLHTDTESLYEIVSAAVPEVSTRSIFHFFK